MIFRDGLDFGFLSGFSLTQEIGIGQVCWFFIDSGNWDRTGLLVFS
jgi:hypothetical protein